MLGSIAYGWLDPFFFGAEHATVKGIDFFAVPKSYLNLLEGRSAFDTWGGEAYGPYGTWYLAHPAFSVFVASWFSFFKPWTAYWLFVLFSLLVMTAAAYVLSRLSIDRKVKYQCYAVLLCSFPAYWMLYVGNMHAPLVLALTLIFTGIYLLTYGDNTKKAERIFMAGLLISFFSKPIVLLMLPLFLLIRETRRSTVICLLVYIAGSFLFIVVTALNPESIGLSEIIRIATDPQFVKDNMNIFKNNFEINEYMRDNSIHWLNLIAQSEHKLMHIDVFSLPVFVDTLRGKESTSILFKLPIHLCLLLSIAVAFISDRKLRLEAVLLLTMTISITFFLSYNTVWEYQYASMLPLIAMLPILKEKMVFYSGWINGLYIAGLFICLPSLYFIVRSGDFQSVSSLTLIRITRVLPVLVLFASMVFLLGRVIVRNADFGILKEFFQSPGKLFFD
jgi:hypothetical protein